MDGSRLPIDAHGATSVNDLDAWLRRHLGRRLTLALIVAEYGSHDTASELVDALARYTELRVLTQPTTSQAAAYLDSLAQSEPEVVLLWTNQTGREAAPGERDQEIMSSIPGLLNELDVRGLRDRAFVALVGSHVTRETARRLGYEDGFAWPTDPAKLAAALARESVAVDERRRRGSSPPCYL